MWMNEKIIYIQKLFIKGMLGHTIRAYLFFFLNMFLKKIIFILFFWTKLIFLYFYMLISKMFFYYFNIFQNKTINIKFSNTLEKVMPSRVEVYCFYRGRKDFPSLFVKDNCL